MFVRIGGKEKEEPKQNDYIIVDKHICRIALIYSGDTNNDFEYFCLIYPNGMQSSMLTKYIRISPKPMYFGTKEECELFLIIR